MTSRDAGGRPSTIRESVPADSRQGPDVVTASDDYARRFAGEVGRWFLERQAESVRDLLSGPVNQTTILDVGGGHGQLVPTLVEAGKAVVVYASPEASTDRVSAWVQRGKVSYTTGDLARLPFADRSFQNVVCVRQISHVESWRPFIRELCRVADQRVIVDYASVRSVNLVSPLLFGIKRRIEGDTRTFRLHRPGEIRAAFQSAGFDVVASRPQFLWPMVLYRAMRSAHVARLIEWPGRATGLLRYCGSPVLVRADRT